MNAWKTAFRCPPKITIPHKCVFFQGWNSKQSLSSSAWHTLQMHGKPITLYQLLIDDVHPEVSKILNRFPYSSLINDKNYLCKYMKRCIYWKFPKCHTFKSLHEIQPTKVLEKNSNFAWNDKGNDLGTA